MSAGSHRFSGRGGEYRLVKEIGRGGMGSVWSGHRYQYDPSTEKEVVKAVAIKLLHPALTLSKSDRERFFSEVQIAAQLEHGRIVKVMDIGTIKGSPFLVMEWVDGRDMSALLKAVNRRLNVNISLFIVGEVLAALEHVHERTIGGADAGVIHYDIKPPNIMISSAGEVKLSDFGISRFAALSESTLSQPIGTPRYMAPEQLIGRAQRESDIYSLGVVLHELLDGQRFLGEIENQHEFHRLVASGFRPELSQPDVPPWLDGLRRQMLADRPSDRPRASDARQLILEKAAHYQLASRHLQELYAEFIGDPTSGVTGVLDIKTFGFMAGPPRPPAPPLPAVAGELGPQKTAQPNEPTFAESSEAEDGAPIHLRRPSRRRSDPDDSFATGTSTGSRGLYPPLLPRLPSSFEPSAEPSLVAWADQPAEPPAEEVEPTVLLESSFPGAPPDAPPAASAPPHTAQMWRLEATPAALPVAEARGPALPQVGQLEPAHGRRNAMLWVLVGVGGVIIVLLVTLLISLTMETDRPSPDDTGIAAVDPREDEVEPTVEPIVEPAAELEPTVEPPEVVEPPELIEPPEVVDDRKEEVEPPPKEEVQKRSPVVKPKPVEVVFVIDGVGASANSTYQIKAGRRELAYNGGAYSKLTPGSYPISWRSSSERPWIPAGTLQVEALPAKSYYDVRIKGTTISVATK